MRGYRFYADIPDTKKLPLGTTVEDLRRQAEHGVHVNCIALLLGSEHAMASGCQEALIPTFAHANSSTVPGVVSPAYLARCRRVPEHLARLLHPRLFARLDAAEK